jgi:hypothetical protein
MKTFRTLSAVVLVACATAAEAQPPAVPAAAAVQVGTLHNLQPTHAVTPRYFVPYVFYPRPHVYRAATAAESYARGRAALIHARGQYNLLSSEARVVHAEAQRREIENRERGVDAYFAIREKNREERAAQRRPRATVEQLRRIAAAGKPAPLSPSELDAVTGEISWPIALQQDEYDAFRADLEALAAEQAAAGQLGADELEKADLAADGILAELKTRIRDVPLQDYTVARRFVERLAHQLRNPAG